MRLRRRGESSAVAERGLQDPTPPVTRRPGSERTGMFGVHGSGDTSGYGLLVLEPYRPQRRPTVARSAERGPADSGSTIWTSMRWPTRCSRPWPSGRSRRRRCCRPRWRTSEITFYVARDHLTALLWAVRDDESLRFELASSISGVDYGEDVSRRLHVVYELTSMTYRRHIRLEVAVDVTDANVPSAVGIYPTADWQEREIWDMFGINFSGHPGSDQDPDAGRLARASAAQGLPARRDPGGVQGCRDPAPDQRRTYS